MDIIDHFEKAKFTASLWVSSDKVFKGFPFSLLVFTWKDVIGNGFPIFASVLFLYLFFHYPLLLHLIFINKVVFKSKKR